MFYLLTYSMIMLVFVYIIERRKRQTTESFLAADRSVGGWLGAMSIAASWIWAPAIFVSTQVGYQWGFGALAWFTIPNMLALVFFGFIAPRVKKHIPQGYSYIESLKTSGGYFMQTQLVLQMVMQGVIFALQLTAGAELLSFVTGASYRETVLIMTFLPLVYSLLSGLHSSILTDMAQYVFILVAIALIYAGFPYGGLDWGHLADKVPFNPLDKNMLVQFGISSAVGLFFAIFADHQQWQRVFAVKAGQETKTFILGGVFHFMVTVSLGALGVLIAASGFLPEKPQMVGAAFIGTHMSTLFMVAFVYMALSGLCSTIDSAFCAFGGLYATEMSKSTDKIKATRRAMLVLALLGLLLAFVRLPIITLWFLAGTLRLAAFAPTVSSIVFPRYKGRVGTVSVVSGIVVGGGIFIVGIVQEDAWVRTCGMLAALTVSLCVSVAGMMMNRVNLMEKRPEGRF